MLPWMKGISDTQAGFKAFSADLLKEILPVDSRGEFSKDFDYNLSFDTDLLSRIRVIGRNIIQVPIARIHFPTRKSTTFSPFNIIKMIWGVFKQRFYVGRFYRRWKRQSENSRESQLAERAWQYKRQYKSNYNNRKRNSRDCHRYGFQKSNV